jgi:hypothetical protein
MGHLPICFYGVARSSSRRRDPASIGETLPLMSQSRDGRGASPRIAAGARPNCNSLSQSAVDGSQSPVTAFGFHDNVISGRFPVLIFYSKTFRFQQKRRVWCE